jgi:hypothetical protein
MKQIGKVLLFLLSLTSGHSQSQARSDRSATVTILAVNAWGSVLPKWSIHSFIDEQGKEWRTAFVKGRAVGIPYGTYRLVVEAGADGFYDEETKLEISGNVFAKIGLDWAGLENDGPGAHFRGILKGSTLSKSDTCRASGLYLRRDYDSPLDPATGAFDFGFIRPGTYALTCVINQAVVVVGTVRLNNSTPAQSFDITGDAPKTDMEPGKK